MMCKILVIILRIIPLALLAQAHARQLGANRTRDSQQSIDKLVDKMVDKLCERALKTSFLHHGVWHTDLEDTTLAKLGHLVTRSAAASVVGVARGSAPFIGSGREVAARREVAGRANGDVADAHALLQLSRRDLILSGMGMVGAAAATQAGPAEAGSREVDQFESPKTAIRPEFNYSKCPSYEELRSPHVVEDFDINRDLPGLYYELAFHDWTQFPLCPTAPRCTTSRKSLQAYSNGDNFVEDIFSLQCFGGFYPQTLRFNISKDPGRLKSYWADTEITLGDTGVPILPKDAFSNVVFPNTVVDFKAGPEGWVLEFQCVETAVLGVVFIGINFYSKVITEQNFQEMKAAGTARGIDFYWNQGLGLSRVSHFNCPVPPAPA